MRYRGNTSQKYHKRPGIKTSEDLAFMNKELGRQAGAVFARILRAFKKMDFKEVQRVLTGGKSK